MREDGVGPLGLVAGGVLLIVAASLVAGFVAADGPPERADATVEKDYYTGEDLADVDIAPRSGRIDFESGPSRTVLVSTDRDPSDLDQVVRALVRNGHEVRIHAPGGGATTTLPPEIASGVPAAPPASGPGEEADLDSRLGNVDALLVVGGTQFERSDHSAIENFRDAGGRIAIGAEPASPGTGASVDALTSRFGVTIGDGYLYDMHENDANYQRVYAAAGDSPVVGDTDRIVVDGAAPVWSDAGTELATTGDRTRYSTTRESSEYSVAVRNGDVVVLGDADVLTPMNYNRLDNNRLLGGVLGFLTDGPRDPYTPPDPRGDGAPTGPSPPSEPPTSGERTQPGDQPTPEQPPTADRSPTAQSPIT